MAPAAGRGAGNRHRHSLERPASRPTAIAAAAYAGHGGIALPAAGRGASNRHRHSLERPASRPTAIEAAACAGHGGVALRPPQSACAGRSVATRRRSWRRPPVGRRRSWRRPPAPPPTEYVPVMVSTNARRKSSCQRCKQRAISFQERQKSRRLRKNTSFHL